MCKTWNCMASYQNIGAKLSVVSTSSFRVILLSVIQTRKRILCLSSETRYPARCARPPTSKWRHRYNVTAINKPLAWSSNGTTSQTLQEKTSPTATSKRRAYQSDYLQKREKPQIISPSSLSVLFSQFRQVAV